MSANLPGSGGIKQLLTFIGEDFQYRGNKLFPAADPPGGDHTSGVGSSRTAAGHAAAPEHFLRRKLSHLLRFPLRPYLVRSVDREGVCRFLANNLSSPGPSVVRALFLFFRPDNGQLAV